MDAQTISTHTSRVGCDWDDVKDTQEEIAFLLTHPVWDVTPYGFSNLLTHGISTHTSRVGCDLPTHKLYQTALVFLLTHPVWDVTTCSSVSVMLFKNFYSHIPCGM